MNMRKLLLSTALILCVLGGIFYLMQNCGQVERNDYRKSDSQGGDELGAMANSIQDQIRAGTSDLEKNVIITHAYRRIAEKFRATLDRPNLNEWPKASGGKYVRYLDKFHANWYHFAIWASRSVGLTMRGTDAADGWVGFAMSVLAPVPDVISNRPALEAALTEINEKIVRRFLGMGNQQVAAEIIDAGDQFADFFKDDCVYDPGRRDEFLRRFNRTTRTSSEAITKAFNLATAKNPVPYDPKKDQDLLYWAYYYYYEAMFDKGGSGVSAGFLEQKIILANMFVGLHEQMVLQPAVAGGLAALDSADAFVSFLPSDALRKNALTYIKKAFTLAIMRIVTPKDPIDCNTAGFAGHLQAQNLGLNSATPMTADDPALTFTALKDALRSAFGGKAFGYGGADWSSYPDRMNFIVGLFYTNRLNSSLESDNDPGVCNQDFLPASMCVTASVSYRFVNASDPAKGSLQYVARPPLTACESGFLTIKEKNGPPKASIACARSVCLAASYMSLPETSPNVEDACTLRVSTNKELELAASGMNGHASAFANGSNITTTYSLNMFPLDSTKWDTAATTVPAWPPGVLPGSLNQGQVAGLKIRDNLAVLYQLTHVPVTPTATAATPTGTTAPAQAPLSATYRFIYKHLTYSGSPCVGCNAQYTAAIRKDTGAASQLLIDLPNSSSLQNNTQEYIDGPVKLRMKIGTVDYASGQFWVTFEAIKVRDGSLLSSFGPTNMNTSSYSDTFPGQQALSSSSQTYIKVVPISLSGDSATSSNGSNSTSSGAACYVILPDGFCNASGSICSQWNLYKGSTLAASISAGSPYFATAEGYSFAGQFGTSIVGTVKGSGRPSFTGPMCP